MSADAQMTIKDPTVPIPAEALEFLAKFSIEKALKDYETLDIARLTAQAEADRLKETQTKIEIHIRRFLDLTRQDVAKVGKLTATRKTDPLPSGENWDDFYAWILQEKAFEFLERRIKKTAVKEYMDAHEGKPPPGVKVFNKLDVSITGLNRGKKESDSHG